MEYICNVPGVFGKCPQWQSIFPHEHGGEVWQAFLLVTGGYPLLETFKEELGSMEHQWIRISCNIKSYCINSKYTATFQLELPQPIPWNFVESDLRCTSRIYFDYMILMLHSVMLTSQKPCQHKTKCDCSKITVINEFYVFFNKISLYFIEKYIKKYSYIAILY